MEIIYSVEFAKSYRKLPEEIKERAEEKEKIFRKDPFDKRLSTHNLKGKLKGLYSFSIDRNYRIVFEFDESRNAIFHIAGNHDIYK